MSGFGATYSGEGQALVVQEKCNKVIDFTSSYAYTNGNNSGSLSITNYENSFLGKKVLTSSYSYFNDKEFSTDGLLNFNAQYYNVDGNKFIVVFISGVHKKCNYSSYEIDFYVPPVTNTALHANLKLKGKGADEFNKLLESNAGLKKLYLKLKAKSDK